MTRAKNARRDRELSRGLAFVPKSSTDEVMVQSRWQVLNGFPEEAQARSESIHDSCKTRGCILRQWIFYLVLEKVRVDRQRVAERECLAPVAKLNRIQPDDDAVCVEEMRIESCLVVVHDSLKSSQEKTPAHLTRTAGARITH